MSKSMVDLCQLLQVQQIKTSVYYPKWLLHPCVPFAVHETPKASRGFTLFELLFGQKLKSRKHGKNNPHPSLPLSNMCQSYRATLSSLAHLLENTWNSHRRHSRVSTTIWHSLVSFNLVTKYSSWTPVQTVSSWYAVQSHIQ